MKIQFLERGNPKLGSNRIYINNLSSWLKPFFTKVVVSKEIKPDFDIFICSKFCDPKDLNVIRKLNSKAIIGLIHPSDVNKFELKKTKLVDFFIVGSIEEKAYFEKYSKNIIRFPQIEDYKLKFKKHKPKKKIIIGYHGNYQNLVGSNQNYIKAIEKISLKYNIEFHIIYDLSLGKYSNKKINIKIFNWSEKNLIKFLSKIDIGVVPATSNFIFDKDYNQSNFILNYFKKFASKYGSATDYLIQFKNKSNPGRSHLFHQAGIPVVAGFWPSHFEIMSDDSRGFLAHSESSWFNSLEKLCFSHMLRNNISKNAFTYYQKNYNKDYWVKKMFYFLQKLKNEKKN